MKTSITTRVAALVQSDRELAGRRPLARITVPMPEVLF